MITLYIFIAAIVTSETAQAEGAQFSKKPAMPSRKAANGEGDANYLAVELFQSVPRRGRSDQHLYHILAV